MQSVATSAALRYIPNGLLAVSEPSPYMFGNDDNTPKKPGWTNENWLKSRFHFSFAEYSNPRNGQFGVLRVMNDDLVQPARGFGTHPHRDMEIATYIVNGSLTHQDSIGSKETLTRGGVQYMSAGTGIRHSEFNESPNKDLRFIQMWLLPRARGLKPNYGGYAGDQAARQDRFQHIVGDVDKATDAAVKIHCDANIYVAELSKGKTATLPVNEVRQAYALVIEGDAVNVKASNAVLGAPKNAAEGDAVQVAAKYDAFEVYGGQTGTTLSFTAPADGPAHVPVVEMAQDGRGGRMDLTA